MILYFFFAFYVVNVTIACLRKPQTVQKSALRDVVSTFTLLSLAGSASAAKGAFEMDAEYYINNILSGNKGEAARSGTERRPIYKSARKVALNISDAIVNEIIDLLAEIAETRRSCGLTYLSK